MATRNPRELKRLKTLRERFTPEEIRRKARKAGRMTGTKFNSLSASEAAKARWDRVREQKLKEERGDYT